MEKTNKGIVLPLDAAWSDIGSWSLCGIHLKKIKMVTYFLEIY